MTSRDLSMNQANNEEDVFADLRKLLSEEYGLILSDNKRGNFKFPVYLSDKLMNVPVEVLDLSQRSFNSLGRAGIKNLYDLFTRFSSKSDFRKIRNCGEKSACEIMEHIFMYQYIALSDKKREKFIKQVIELNRL